MTHRNCRRSVLVAMAAISVLLVTALPAGGQGEDAEGWVRLERTLSTAHAVPGSTFLVTLSIQPLEDLEGVGIREALPFGWTIHPVETDGAAFKRSESEWVFPDRLSQGSTIELVYEVTVPPADRLYADPLPQCFEITGTFQAAVPAFEMAIPGDNALEVNSGLPIPTAVAHLIPGIPDEPDRIDLRLDQRIGQHQLQRALAYWATDSAVPWTEGEIIDLVMIEKLTAYYEVCMDVDEPLPPSIDPDLAAIRKIETFLPCDSVLLPEGCLDPGLPARQFSVTVEISGSYDAYGVGLAEWFPETWRVTPVAHPGFTYRPSKTEWIYPDRLPAGQKIAVEYLVEVIESTTDRLSAHSGCCGAASSFVGMVSDGLECSEAAVGGDSEAYLWDCLPVLLAISRWDVEEDRLDATLPDSISFPQVQRAVDFWLSSAPVPHTCGYTVGYHMLKRIIAHWIAGTPITQSLPDEVPSPCEDSDGCYIPTCPDGTLCHLREMQSVDDYVGVPDAPRLSVTIEGARELTCAVPATTLRAVVKGGSAPLRYEWRGQGGDLLGTSDRFEVREPGSYTAIVVSVGGCRVGQRVVISEDVEVPQVSVSVDGTLDCNRAEVTLTASVLGGRPPFEVHWFGERGAPLGTGEQLLVDTPGRYTAVVEGANGCSGSAALQVSEDVVPPEASAGPDRTLTCTRTSVLLEGSASGGREPYTYRWTDERDAVVSTESSVTVDRPGTFTLTVTGANGCSNADEAVVVLDTDPPEVALSASGSITCIDSSVTLSAAVDGGPAPVRVTWLDPSGAVIGSTLQIDVTQVGTYTAIVEGGNGCAAEASIAVAEDTEPPSVCANADGNLTCADLEVELTAAATEGTPPYTYEWFDEEGRTIATDATVSVCQVGTYTVEATGGNGCTGSDSVTVAEDTEPPAVTASASGPLTCRTPAVTVSAAISGGRTPYTIEWTGPSGAHVGSSKTVSVEEPGTYTVKAVGANGCSASDSVTVTRDIAPPTVDASASGTLSCSVTEVTLSATICGGSEPYAMAWSDASGAVLGTAEQVVVDRAGTYRVTVTGANGCAASDTVSVSEDLLAPVVDVSIERMLTCAVTETTLSVTIEGGRRPYEIAWTDDSSRLLGTAESLLVDKPGTYTVTVIGANGCSRTETITVSRDAAAPDIDVSVSGPLTCADPEAALAVAVEGGRPPYEIAWTDDSSRLLGTAKSLLVDEPGTYTVTVFGANGCSTSDTIDVVEDVAAPHVDVTASGAITCATPEVTLTAIVSGGRAPFRCIWSDCCGSELGSGRELTVSEPGIYFIRVTGENGCSATASVEVASDLDTPQVDATVDGVLSCAVSYVTLTASASGGRPPYAYRWTDPSGAEIGIGPTAGVYAPDTYTVTVVGDNGCSASTTVTVTEDVAPPVVDLGPDPILTCTQPEVVLSASPCDGSGGPYRYVWRNRCGDLLGTASELRVTTPGTYTVTVTGANGCSTTDSVAVHDGIDPPTVDLGPDRILDCCPTAVELVATISGGATPYSYEWYNACDVLIGTAPTLSVTQPDTYLLIVRTPDGCIGSDSVVVREP